MILLGDPADPSCITRTASTPSRFLVSPSDRSSSSSSHLHPAAGRLKTRGFTPSLPRVPPRAASRTGAAAGDACASSQITRAPSSWMGKPSRAARVRQCLFTWLANNALHLTVADGRAAARPSLWRPQVNANTLGGQGAMNPGYVRLATPLERAVARMRRWIALPELAAPRRVPISKAVSLACDGAHWRGEALTFYEVRGWSVFEDLSGVLVARSTDEWLRLAERTPLVFASYNDAIPYGELVIVEDGELVRELRDEPAKPAWSKNIGRLPEESDKPYDDWTDVGYFVDSDVFLAEQPQELDLWIFQARRGPSAQR